MSGASALADEVRSPSPAAAASHVCSGEMRSTYAQADMANRVKAYQVLTEEALSLREQAIAFLHELKDKDSRGEPLSGGDLKHLNQGAAALFAQRRSLLAAAAEYECWLDDPVPADPAAARAQATGIAMSLSAALILYDNYLTVVGLYRATPFLRQHLNRKDAGFAIPPGELNRISVSFSSAINRARVRRGLNWHGTYGRILSESDNQGERYLAALIEQSPSLNMVRRLRPIGYAENLMGFFGVLSIDTLNQLKNEGINFSSMVFGNAVGLVETRRGKLDGNPQLVEKVVGTLRAGDILLEKTPFRLTDAFIPGHWGHAAVWVGNERELRELGIWEHPVVRPHQARIRDGRGVIEALRAGVKMNTLTHFLNVDDLAVLRREAANPEQQVEVILQALRQVGKAYDFNFDVESTDRIVCSELVYHAYGDIRWPTARHLGRATVSPDNIAVLATGDGPLSVSLLYHDGREVAADSRRYISALVKPEVVKVARGG
ncbi:YiiX/YebB-like N1pC/P60 family cysteine hydrolase [Dechloromonas sp. A34]|uniref:YiiX/YebB-like N1pC/P60 family cysteine hydrolase n=1 Tax=Dechloromonas sp. A34 TaxID=447588 RepID=UPI0022497937|nr:YiiX/YebB-like N1pC/P60 family cysteine hydrolase [Dechloromonas sp. A34]